MVERPPFVMLPKALLSRADVSLTAKVVFATIIDAMRDADTSWPSVRAIQRTIGVNSEGRVWRAIQEIEAAGLLVVSRQGRGRSNLYRLPTTSERSTCKTHVLQESKVRTKCTSSTCKMNVEVRAKRTSKETETKERDRGGARDPQKGRRGGAHQGLIDYFAEQWSRVIGGGAKYPFAKGKDGTAAKRILESVNGDLGRARRMVDAYLSDPDPYLKGRGKGRGLALLAGHVRLPMYIAETASRTNAGAGHARPVEHPIVSECRERWPADVMAHLADYLSIAARVEAGRLVGKVVKQSDAKDGPAFRLECHTEGKTRAG